MEGLDPAAVFFALPAPACTELAPSYDGLPAGAMPINQPSCEGGVRTGREIGEDGGLRKRKRTASCSRASYSSFSSSSTTSATTYTSSDYSPFLSTSSSLSSSTSPPPSTSRLTTKARKSSRPASTWTAALSVPLPGHVRWEQGAGTVAGACACPDAGVYVEPGASVAALVPAAVCAAVATTVTSTSTTATAADDTTAVLGQPLEWDWPVSAPVSVPQPPPVSQTWASCVPDSENNFVPEANPGVGNHSVFTTSTTASAFSQPWPPVSAEHGSYSLSGPSGSTPLHPVTPYLNAHYQVPVPPTDPLLEQQQPVFVGNYPVNFSFSNTLLPPFYQFSSIPPTFDQASQSIPFNMVQKPLVLLSGADGQHVHPEVDVTYPTTGGQQNSGAAGLASFEQPLSDIGPSDSVNICVASAYQYSPPSSSSNTSAAAVGVPGGYGPSAVPSMSPTQQQEDRLTSTEIQAENKPALAKPHRSPLEGEKRKQTEQTRKWKACIRCRMQKKRCLPDERDPEKSDCLTCRAVSLDSKKVIHRLPCLRWKLTEVVIFREGGLNLTKRWEGVKVKDLAPRDWVGEPSRTIFMSLGLCSNPIALRVKKFRPKAGDVTARNWIDPDGERQVTPIAPYALADIHQTTQTYCRYVCENAFGAVRQYTESLGVDPLIKKTFQAAWSQAQHLRRLEVQSGPDNIDQADFLTKYFQLWFASRVTQGSAYLVGPEMLDMEPDYRPGYPYPGKINLPRMVSAQFDSFGHVYVLRPLRKEILEKLWEMMATKKACYFFTIYLTVFMMLHEISATSRDRHRHYEQNCRSGLYHDRKGHYTLESFVESLQEGGNIILSHWHYYKRDLQPLALDLNPKSSAVYSELLPHESELLTEAVQAYEIRERWPMVKATGYHRFDEDLYFVSQMFEENWQPRATFSR